MTESSEADSSTTAIVVGDDDRDDNLPSSSNTERGQGDVGSTPEPSNIEDNDVCGGPSFCSVISEGEGLPLMEAEGGGGGGSARVKGETEESTAIRTSRRSKRISKKQGRVTGAVSLNILQDILHITLLPTHHVHYLCQGIFRKFTAGQR